MIDIATRGSSKSSIHNINNARTFDPQDFNMHVAEKHFVVNNPIHEQLVEQFSTEK